MHEKNGSSRSTLPWLAGVGAGLCTLPAATAIYHMQLLTDEVEERPRLVVGETEALCRDASFFVSELFPLIPKKILMQTQAEEFVEMADLLPDSFKSRRVEDGAPRGRAAVAAGEGSARRVALWLVWVRCFAACTAVIVEKHPNKVKIPAGVPAADCKLSGRRQI